MFRGREQAHPERGEALLRKLADELAELGTIEQQPNQEGRNMTMVLAPVKAAPVKAPSEDDAAVPAAASPVEGDAGSSRRRNAGRAGRQRLRRRKQVGSRERRARRIARKEAIAFPRDGLSDGAIRLRPPGDADAGWIAESVVTRRSRRWTRVPSPYTKDDAFGWIALAESMAREGGAYNLVITAAEDGGRLGSVGLEVHDDPAPHGELGYWVAAPARGRGVATRAVRLLASWALEQLALPFVEIHVLPANTASQAVARRAGFEPAGQRLLPFRGRVEEFDIYVLRSGETTGAAVAGRPVA